LGLEFFICLLGKLYPFTKVCLFVKDTKMRNSFQKKISSELDLISKSRIRERLRRRRRCMNFWRRSVRTRSQKWITRHTTPTEGGEYKK